MTLIGYQFLDDGKTIRSSETLSPQRYENPEDFVKRCKSLGFTACDSRNIVDHYKFLENELILGDICLWKSHVGP